MSTCPDLVKNESNKENLGGITQCQQARLPEEMVAVKVPLSERPPYSYMAMMLFAINSDKNRRMTLKEIYNWIEDPFPYFRNVAKPGWKNFIRYNLSLHDMFVRETTADGKTSYWTIKPESNRYLTLDQVYKFCCDHHWNTRVLPGSNSLVYTNTLEKSLQLVQHPASDLIGCYTTGSSDQLRK